MGCDIHMVLEQRHKNGHWIGVNNFGWVRDALSTYAGESVEFTWRVRRRNYRLFAELAGVRGEGSVPREPQGLPMAPSELTEMELDHWGGDAHSVSWLPVVAFAERYLIATDKQSELVTEKLDGKTDLVEVTIGELFAISVDNFKDFDKYRVVFWFDN